MFELTSADGTVDPAVCMHEHFHSGFHGSRAFHANDGCQPDRSAMLFRFGNLFEQLNTHFISQKY
jgi:hypothetical protein